MRPTFFTTAACWNKTAILQSDCMATLLMDVLMHYRDEGKFILHEFVIMPDHIHLLITPAEGLSIEKVMQFVKGGFSYRAKRELDYAHEVWQPSFHDRRVRDEDEFQAFKTYIRMNPVRRGLVKTVEEWKYVSLNSEVKAQSSDAKITLT